MVTKLRRSSWILSFALLAGATPAWAQGNLEDLLLDILSQGVTLAPPAEGTDHSAHFTAESASETSQFAAVRSLNLEVGRQVSTFPQASSAGGFSYQFDPELGVLTRPTHSFGAVYSDRPFTVGRGKYNVGLAFAQFSYDEIDGIGLRDGGMSLVFAHEDADANGLATPFFEGDVVTAQLFVGLDVNVAAFTATYGVSDRFDMGINIPILDVALDIATVANVERLATEDAAPTTHLFTNGTTSSTTRRGGEVTGVGDVSFTGRWLLAEYTPDDLRAAFTGTLRLPTGDEENFLGSGGTEIGGAFLLSQPLQAAAWHGVLGISAGSNDLPLQFHYSTGFDWAVDSKLTVAADLLGRFVNERAEVVVEDEDYLYNQATDGSVSLATASFPTLAVTGEDESRNVLNASFGFKLNVASTVLLTANGVVPLNDSGLRDEFSTLFGIDYSF